MTNPLLKKVYILTEDKVKRCGFCGMPWSGSGMKHVPPVRGDFTSDNTYFPYYHTACGWLDIWFSSYYGLSQAVRFGKVINSRKVRKELARLADLYYKAYYEWEEWFIKEYGKRSLKG